MADTKGLFFFCRAKIRTRTSPLLPLHSLRYDARLTVAVEVDSVVTLPGTTAGAAFGVVVQMALAIATVAGASRSQAAQLAVLVHRVANPVDARIAADCLVRRVDQDHLVEPAREGEKRKK